MATTIQLAKTGRTPAPVGATLIKTGQTTSYRTGDDGDLQAGREANFFRLESNNPFGNIDRFTDVLGGQTYANNIVVDWSTYNGSNVLGYTRNLSPTNIAWNDAVDQARATSIGTYTSGWRLTNRAELSNILTMGGVTLTVLNYAPFNVTVDLNVWTSTTSPLTTTNAYALASTGNGNMSSVAKTVAACRYYACRTFTVTGTTLT